MFYQVRFQTGEIKEMVSEMKTGKIPCMDVIDMDEYNWVLEKLSAYGIQRATNIPLNKDARDRLKETEFEFRAAFTSDDNKGAIMYIDFYFEPFIEEEYDSAYGD
ncbi:hypothetical protein [Acetivibrio cellulolyticus]|uniref:hypothetical protein n=1 Tax=Acetivibrio cellulolyticus TaxID=35830 RepID=UPI0001E2E2C3|nr:hypothetical protein [Acetivibrio cellulolyticus]